MASIRVEVTTADIAACSVVPDVGDGFASSHPDHKEPVELALARLTGCDTILDEDRPHETIATIGQEQTTLVVGLPRRVCAWTDAYYRGEPVEPFAFDLEIEAWLVALVAPDDRDVVTLAEAADALGVQPNTLRTAARQRRDGQASDTAIAGRLGMRKLGRDWVVPRVNLGAEVARRAGRQ